MQPPTWKRLAGDSSENWLGEETLLPLGVMPALTATPTHTLDLKNDSAHRGQSVLPTAEGAILRGDQNAFPTASREHELFLLDSCQDSLRKTNYCGLPCITQNEMCLYFLEQFS